VGQRARLAVRRDLATHAPAIGETLVAAVRAQIPAYRQLEPGQTAEIQAIAAWALTRIVELWVSGGSLDARDLARFRGIGAARARDGRPLTAVLRAYRVAAGLAIEYVVKRDRDLPGQERLDVEDVLALTQLWLASVDELSEALFAGHSAAAEQLAGDRQRALRELLDDLLVGRQASAGALADRLARLSVALPAQPALLLVEPVDVGVPVTEADISALVAELGLTAAEPAGHLATIRGRRLALLLSSADAITGAVARRAWRGCLITRQTLVDTPMAYRLATDALDTAPPHAYDSGPLLTDGDAHVLALLAARGTASPEQVIRTVIGPLADPGNRHLLDGLDAFLATGSAAAAAAHLRVHPQTLRYRLRRIHELTGRDPRLPWQRFVLDIARHLLDIGSASR
jgi:hypothetical protein